MAITKIPDNLIPWRRAPVGQDGSGPRAPRCVYDCPIYGFGRILIGASVASFAASVVTCLIGLWKLIR